MANRRLYEVCVGDGGIGYCTNCGNDRATALRLFNQRKAYEYDIYLKSFDEHWGDERVLKEYHKTKKTMNYANTFSRER